MTHPPIPLHEPDLGPEEEAAVRAVLAARGAWRDAALTRAWEEVWAEAWQREALAFADAGELLGVLKTLLGWRNGAEIALSPLLEPVWREALGEQNLIPLWLGVEPVTGHALASEAQAVPHLLEHTHGLPRSAPAGGFTLEEITALSLPRADAGWGSVQVAALDGNALPCAGGTALLLSRDGALMAEARRLRQHPPTAAACALGLAQWRRLPELLEQRAERAERYAGLRHRGFFVLPPVPEGGRNWGRYLLTLTTPEHRAALEAFLSEAAIGCGSPLWWSPTPEALAMPGVTEHLARSLALPLHGGVDPVGQKRIINRIHRWAERCPHP